MLALGVAFGSYLTVLLLIALEYVADRRAARRTERLGNRRPASEKGPGLLRPPAEPHPAELLEASVRDLELNLYDAVDRVDDAIRRDGLQ